MPEALVQITPQIDFGRIGGREVRVAALGRHGPIDAMIGHEKGLPQPGPRGDQRHIALGLRLPAVQAGQGRRCQAGGGDGRGGQIVEDLHRLPAKLPA